MRGRLSRLLRAASVVGVASVSLSACDASEYERTLSSLARATAAPALTATGPVPTAAPSSAPAAAFHPPTYPNANPDPQRWPNLYVLPPTRAVISLFTTIRDKSTPHGRFAAAADRLMRLLAEEGLAQLPGAEHVTVTTPCGTFDGLRSAHPKNVIAVSIVRAGDTLLEAARAICPQVSVGKILIQRDEADDLKRPKLFYIKLPPGTGTSVQAVLLVDPMLATGQSAKLAIRELLARGVAEESIVFLNVVACPEGLDALFAAHPQVRIVTGAVDSHLNAQRYICPGLGDFGDRFFGTIEP